MKCFVDGDQVCVVHDDFVDLQESPVVFVPLNTELGQQLANGGVAAATDEAALYLVKSLKLCVMPFGDSWSAFPKQYSPAEDYIQKTNAPTIRGAVLRGALFCDEMSRRYETGLACMMCKAKVIKLEIEGVYRCRCQEAPIFRPVRHSAPEFDMVAFPHWFAADLVLD
jgi:hypothetical protein